MRRPPARGVAALLRNRPVLLGAALEALEPRLIATGRLRRQLAALGLLLGRVALLLVRGRGLLLVRRRGLLTRVELRHLLGGARRLLRTEQVVELRGRLPVPRRTRPDPVRGPSGHRGYELGRVGVPAALRRPHGAGAARNGRDVLRGVRVPAGRTLTALATLAALAALTARPGLRRQRLRVRLGLRLRLRLLGLVLLLGVLRLVRTGLLGLVLRRLRGRLVGAGLLRLRLVEAGLLRRPLVRPGLLRLLVRPGLLVHVRSGRLLRGRQGLRRRVAVAPLRLLLRSRRPPLLTPRLTARGHRLLALLPALAGPGRPGRPGGSAVGRQHDTLVRGSCGGELVLAALSALRHQDSYV
ncbi:hypothetical protein SPW_4911 [Streptomyces sp. W007]|nr:hypothetical protein SPW_4911 [Streptomyces sp. W007]